MEKPNDKLLLKRILTTYDQLGLIRKQIFDGRGTQPTIEKLKRQSQKKINEINKEFKDHEFEGPLATLLKRYRLNKYQIIIILALLRQRLIFPSPHLLGREVLQLIFDDSYGILRGMTLIDSSSLLVSTGIIIPDLGEEDEDLLETRFRLSDRVFSMIYNTFAPARTKDRTRNKKGEENYPNNMGYLMDMRRLALLYQKKATKVFNYDYWDEIGLGVSESVEGINRQIELLRNQIKSRLERTDVKTRLYTWKFFQDFNLTEDDIIIVVTLLFQEITEGNAYLNAVDLVRLTSESEEDLIRKRHFFSPKRNLVKHKIIQLEEMVNSKEMTAEVYMVNWAIEKMLGGLQDSEGPSFDADAKLDFHKYLKNIESSEDLFNDLDLEP
ncbi:MAG: hypothetical protein ABIK28_10530 [Planctomycetota bacterium]